MLLALVFLLSSGIDESSGELKLQKKEKEKDKKRKEKKDKKKEKKKNLKLSGKLEETKEKKHSIKEIELGRNDETEQLEKSSVTEELGQPTGVHCFDDSSDSIQSTGKRKKHEIGIDAAHNHGNGLRIRFSLRKIKDPELPSDKEMAPSCSTIPAQEPVKEHTEMDCLGSDIDRMEAQVKDLINYWKFPPLHHIEPSNFDDQEWLFGSKRRQKEDNKRRRLSDDKIDDYSGSRASYLSAADVFALPYVLPY